VGLFIVRSVYWGDVDDAALAPAAGTSFHLCLVMAKIFIFLQGRCGLVVNLPRFLYNKTIISINLEML
jgi:hypothetical protein